MLTLLSVHPVCRVPCRVVLHACRKSSSSLGAACRIAFESAQSEIYITRLRQAATLYQPGVLMAASTPHNLDGVKRGRPLKQAIQECELRWFHETAVAAADGEANQMALLGHMYSVGYGCKADAMEASKWFAEASKRLGYNVLTDQPPLMSSAGPQPPQQFFQQQQQQQAPEQHIEVVDQHQQQQQQQGQVRHQPWRRGASDPAGQAGSSTVGMLQFTGVDNNTSLAGASHPAAAAAAVAVAPSILQQGPCG